MLTGKHLIAGDWVATPDTFLSNPASGKARSFSRGTPALVDQAVRAAEEAFWTFGYAPRSERAALLRRIASEIEARLTPIIEIGTSETGLPEARLHSECSRTTGQLRLFADHVEAGGYLDRRHDPPIPDRQPMPRPDLRVVQRPIGPIAVFGASNFPLAFSTAGGDTASALAAGCPVVVKGHPAHPGTGEVVAHAIAAAVAACGVHPGVFSLIQDGAPEVGQALVRHPLIRAVGFTGSLGGGRTLFDLCAARPEPIPFFGELGSVNPMFLLPAAMGARAQAIARGWSASLSLGAGQFCTNPGIAVVIEGEDAEVFAEAAVAALVQVGVQTMLSDGIARAYREGHDRIAETDSVQVLLPSNGQARSASPGLIRVRGADWLKRRWLGEEVFGPLGLIVTVRDVDEMAAVAAALQGQLTCTLHLDDGDLPLARRLMPVLERKAGRILTNGFPTGVEVCDAMVHGGPYPASTNFGHTSVGTLSIRRWLRPVCYQDMPQDLRPIDLP